MERHAMTRLLVTLLVAGPLAIAGCGGDDGAPPPGPSPTPTATATPSPTPTPQPTAFLIPVLPGAPRMVSNGFAISADGRVVVGLSESDLGDQAFRWTTNGNLQGLGMLAGYTASSAAHAVSADGSVVVGVSSASADSFRAFTWTAATGMQPLGELPDWVVRSAALGISADGQTVVGWAEGVDPNYDDDKTLCFVWTADAGFHLFGDFLPANVNGTYCKASAVSANARVTVGEARYDIVNDLPVMQGFRFTRDSGLFPLGWVDNQAPTSNALSASANGSVIGGSSDVMIEGLGNVPSPLRWTTTGGPVWLGLRLLGTVNAVSADGTAMGGGAADPGTAFVWDVENGYRNLYGLLLEAGLADGLEGGSPINVSGMTPDGRVVVGTSLGAGLARAYYVRLP